MNILITLTVVLALIGSTLIGGVFFAFSSFIMKALAQRPAMEGIKAMQSINIVVINPVFIGAFIGTALISLLLSIISVATWDMQASPYFLIGGLFYIIGTFMVTVMGNVPLNNQLAVVKNNTPDASDIWHQYQKRWTRLNTIRTVCALCGAIIILMGVIG